MRQPDPERLEIFICYGVVTAAIVLSIWAMVVIYRFFFVLGGP